MTIGRQSGITSTDLADWYGDLILDELSLEAFLARIERRVTDAGLLVQFQSLKNSLPLVGSNPTPPSVAGAPIVSER